MLEQEFNYVLLFCGFVVVIGWPQLNEHQGEARLCASASCRWRTEVIIGRDINEQINSVSIAFGNLRNIN